MNRSQREQLATYKKANKERKKKILEKLGYKDQAEYFSAIGVSKKAPVKVAKAKTAKSGQKHTVHNVFIMDDSGSMSGGKYTNGVAGIKMLVEGIKEEGNTLVNNTVSIVDLNRGVVHWMKDAEEVSYEGHRNLGCTPLYRTIGQTIDRLLREVGKEDKVLLNITTDGQDTEGWQGYEDLPQILKKIQKENNFTVTFVGTERDVKYIQDHLNVDASNTLVHDNTAEGMTRSFSKTLVSRSVYSMAVSNDEDVTVGFYKETGTL